MLRVIDLFAGIGGFSLGLHMAGGFETIGFVEKDDYCQRVLAKNFPGIPIHDDVRTFEGHEFGPTDVVCGGFPCQDISLAGRRSGLEGERSGLWTEIARVIGDVRPSYAIVENTPGLLSLGMGTVLGDLATLGYDAQWYCIPACYVGADHIRDRVWIVAYPNDRQSIDERWATTASYQVAENVADALCEGLPRRSNSGTINKNAPRIGERIGSALRTSSSFSREYREHQPVMGRGVHGLSNRVDRIKALGNAVVPQVVEAIGRAILEAERHE